MNSRVVVEYVEEELKNYEETLRQIEEIRFEILNSTPLRYPGSNPERRSDPTAVKAITLVSNTVLSRMERTVRAVERVLASLPEDQRKLFELKFIRQKTKRQICMELSISERTFHRWKKDIVNKVARELGLAYAPEKVGTKLAL